MQHHLRIIVLSIAFFSIGGCAQSPFELESGQNLNVLENFSHIAKTFKADKNSSIDQQPESLVSIIDNSPDPKIVAKNFKSAIKQAVDRDPEIIIAKERFTELGFAVDAIARQKDFKFSGTVYGGIEDVTDKTRGVAMVLNAKRLLFDGGRSDLILESERYNSESVRYDLLASVDNRANYFGNLWIDLLLYESLHNEIEKRLTVLEPLIKQLEQVSEAGVGDVSRVAAAQRTVSMIRVTKTDVTQKLDLARLNFRNVFGTDLVGVSYDDAFIRGLVPDQIDSNMKYRSPAIQSAYNSYLAAEFHYKAIQLNESFNVGFEARASRPFGGSGYDSDESIGLVARKTLFNGDMQSLEISQANSRVKSAVGTLQLRFKEGHKMIESARQTINSMNQAISLAVKSSQIAEDEIVYLRRQLVIGGSTLDNVLSAEARLYEAQSKEIMFQAEKRKAELLIVAALGLISETFGL